MADPKGPATVYSAITKAVDKLVIEHAENDPDRAAYLVARAALVGVRGRSGPKRAFDMAAGLGDELFGEIVE